MKHYLFLYLKGPLIMLVFAVILIGCSTETETDPPTDNNIRTAKQTTEDLMGYLSQVDSIQQFAGSFSSLSLDDDQVINGLTLIVPIDQQTESEEDRQAATGESSRVSVDFSVEDHVISGEVDLFSLEDGHLLTALSGKQVRVSRQDDLVYLNGVQVIAPLSTKVPKSQAFLLPSPLTDFDINLPIRETVMNITVMDATEWSPINLDGLPVSGAEVRVYRSKSDYFNGEYILKSYTNQEGHCTIRGLENRYHYVEVVHGEKSNIFDPVSRPEWERITGLEAAGIFSNLDQIQRYPSQKSMELGGIRWKDQNQDGTIDDQDRISMPGQYFGYYNGHNWDAKIYIGYPDGNPRLELDKEEAQAMLGEVSLELFWKDLAIIDGLMVNQATNDGLPSIFHSILGFRFGPQDPAIAQVWKRAYDSITLLDFTIAYAGAGAAEEALQARAWRAYVYLQLSQYFGNVPMLEKGQYANQVPKEDMFDYLVEELGELAELLPRQMEGYGLMTRYGAKTLLARISMEQGDSRKTTDLCREILGSEQFQLEQGLALFNPVSRENIWSARNYNHSYVQDYFFGREYWAPIRLTEIHLMLAESRLARQDALEAMDIINLLRDRSGQSPVIETEGLRKVFEEQWFQELAREGSTFTAIRRWEKEYEYLYHSGFNANKNTYLPIPQVVIDDHFEMMQNRGY
ncbi:RagB/SusD family nutrient uptake outer membrane protein [Echinicola soli]|nr:RagB/SusD family nutrient uptake outer membrane protein [Echinicola soli]